MFLEQEHACGGCPVYAKTQASGCALTPYDDYLLAEETRNDGGKTDAAESELAFLKSLLPDEAEA
jgi:hypothetical protein